MAKHLSEYQAADLDFLNISEFATILDPRLHTGPFNFIETAGLARSRLHTARQAG
jgi:hypothetical protein